jgi:outer membrane protein OmpA-like peptidoglycan-associated protein
VTKEPKTPVTKEPKTPVTKEPKTPVTKEPKTPATKEPKTPVTKEPKTPVTKEPKTPVTKEPKTPVTKEPVTKEPEQPDAVTLNNVFFDFNKATIRPESRTALRYLIDFLKEHTAYRIEIAGHTDSVGTAEFNLRLSRERAEAVRDYLIAKGIAANRLVAKGYGATKPRATNDTEEGRQQNRRTEFSFLKK